MTAAAMKPVAIGIGEILWDRLPSGPRMGGAPANFACHARALGAGAQVVSRVGDDAAGAKLLRELAAPGLPVSGISIDPGPSTGSVIWVFISEILPNRQRAEGQTLGSATHWVFAALLTTLFPKIVELSGANEHPQRAGFIFVFFCFMMFLQLVWVKLMVPETKGVPLEDMQKKLGIE